ncbi:putative transcription factor FAR family [Helianthus annuus]|uniref:Protein FAR1-RELATED SEQUENCE n=2 Tax=Helianthus annuus TaxID=4232 RepID=A0A9K3HJQ8_HELAN|nr:protein FAR-RED IMPAIRED RESPONSE 1 [Helianthus annuus]XP_021998846.1 protein FAR-RED IMPAIRED RESPONSE 1 [Helianthus annuus]KAF5779582.1 putative transcription factor FAR family [Helianthus annuus]KAJ0490850.1 putative transcription factor FAR family [Helianthus annuus]KAJ0506754.1 putative transcription factor FAR family [Helianthus annuus]KAJ0676433.1 putative transcription factor FAR family [Helianthus annuus]KAJ0864327.1 putative transcription factor FAR family [Helianthus annuus]
MSGNIPDTVDEGSDKDGQIVTSPARNVTNVEGDKDYELHDGIEFESHEAAYAFYQEYAKSMGFTTSIKNSRRSKKSKEFIDAKFACSRYGVTPESDGGTHRRPSVKKTDCKASMHVKRRKDGKWYIHEFIKEHNHELLPALAYHFRIHKNIKLAEKNNIDILYAVSERTKKMYVQMSRQSFGNSTVDFLREESNYNFDRGRYLSLEEGDGQVILEYFMHVKKENPKFFYAIDLNEDQRLRNLFWVDAKSRKDYTYFSDVVSFDISYVRSNDKMPFALFIGVNHHFQAMLLGCGLVADESKSTYVWLMKMWLRSMGGIEKAPKFIITDQGKTLEMATIEVFPNSRHCISLWSILEKIPENLAHVIRRNDKFMSKFNNCIYKTLTEEEFDMRWWELAGCFELHENEWFHSLYEDRKKWVPAFMKDAFLAGMSTTQRAESVNSFFDKYIHKKVTLKEFIRQYGSILENRYQEEAIADFDTCHKQPALKSPSPWEKQMSSVYTHTIFKKFQIETLGMAGCHPKPEREDELTTIYAVNDSDKDETFTVTWHKTKSEIWCSCLLFEYKGFLCRHALIVLLMCGLPSIPSRYILKRWTKDAKSDQSEGESNERLQTRVQLYNDLCKHAIQLGEEGSLSEESYDIAFRALVEALKTCVNVNNKESSNSAISFRDVEDENLGGVSVKTSKRKSVSKKRKVPLEPEPVMLEARDSLQQMENMSSDGITLHGYYGTQPNVQGLLNLMEPPHDGYYVNQQSMQGLGQLNSLAPTHDGFFEAQQSMHGLGHLDFRPTSFGYNMQDEPSLRINHLQNNPTRHS